MNKNEVIILTAAFPYGKGETFLETELPYLVQSFDTVQLLALSPTQCTQRQLPPNCKTTTLPIELSMIQKIMTLRYLFSKSVQRELAIIQNVYDKKITRGILSTLLVSFERAHQIAKALERLIDKNKNQIFYSYWCEDSAIALALLKQKYPQKKAITRMHGWDVYFEVSEVNYLPFRHLIATHLDGLFPISEKGKKYVKEVWKINNLEKVIVSRLGVQKQIFNSLESKPFSIVSCSNVIPLKRVELIAQALKLIALPYTWTHFGDGPLLEEIKTEFQNEHHLFKGRVTNTDVLTFYKKHTPHLFINVSSSEGIPVSIMEAFSFGMPVIATDVGGNEEIVNWENGTLVSANISAEGLSEIIQEYIEMNEESYYKKRLAAYKTWEEGFNAGKNYGEFLESLRIFSINL